MNQKTEFNELSQTIVTLIFWFCQSQYIGVVKCCQPVVFA